MRPWRSSKALCCHVGEQFMPELHKQLEPGSTAKQSYLWIDPGYVCSPFYFRLITDFIRTVVRASGLPKAF